MRFRKYTSDDRLRCQSDIKRNGYWTGKQCSKAAVCTFDGVPLCGNHRHQRLRWRPDAVIQDIQQRATIGP